MMRRTFWSVLYLGDGIFVEINIAERLHATTQCWERLTKGIMCLEAPNGDKLNEAGTWEIQQIMLCFVLNLDLLTISLQGGMTEQFCYLSFSQNPDRNLSPRWESNNCVAKSITARLSAKCGSWRKDLLIPFRRAPMENGMYIQRPDPAV